MHRIGWKQQERWQLGWLGLKADLSGLYANAQAARRSFMAPSPLSLFFFNVHVTSPFTQQPAMTSTGQQRLSIAKQSLALVSRRKSCPACQSSLRAECVRVTLTLFYLSIASHTSLACGPHIRSRHPRAMLREGGGWTRSKSLWTNTLL